MTTVILATTAPTTVGPMALALAAGVLSIWVWLASALFSAVVSLFPQPSEAKQTQPTAVTHVLIASAVAVLVTTSLRWFLLPVADAVVPNTLDIRSNFVHVVAAGGAVTAGALCGWLVLRLRRGRWLPAPLWLGAPLLALFHLLVVRELDAAFASREHFVDVATLGLLLVFLSGLRKIADTRFGKVSLFLLVTTSASCAAFLAFGLGSMPKEHAAFVKQFPGPSNLLFPLRALWDLDGDGLSAAFGGMDCDDSNPEVGPLMIEIVGNGIDDNCVGGDLPRYVRPSPVTGPERSAHSNIILLTIDAWRADMLSPEPGSPQPMPRMTELTSQCAAFTNTYAQAPYTEHSLSSLMTGHHPWNFGDGVNFFGQEPSLAEHLSWAGYDTIAMHSIWLLHPYVIQGFQRVEDELAALNRDYHGTTSDQMSEHAIDVFRQLSAEETPYFFWVHYFDPHTDYVPREGTPFSGDTVRARYLQEIWATDRAVGRFLDQVMSSRFLETGWLVITGDHGELLGEDNRVGHSFWLDEEVLRVPMFVCGPSVEPGRFDTRVRLLDIYPTLLEQAAGLYVHAEGRSLAPIWHGESAVDRDVLARTTLQYPHARAAIVGPYKLVQDLRSGSESLYRLDHDPGEENNLIAEEPRAAETVRHTMGDYLDKIVNDVVLLRKWEVFDERALPEDQMEQYMRDARQLACERGWEDACD